MAWTETSVLMTVLSFGQVVVMDGEERIGEERQKLVENLGRRIRELRTQQGISQEGLAALAGIDRGYMGHIERGSRNISVVKIFAIVGALSVPPGALFETPRPAAGTASSEIGANTKAPRRR